MMRRAIIEDRLRVATLPQGSASDAAGRRRLWILWSCLFGGLLFGGFLAVVLDGSAVARSGSGYGDLIDSYCIDRGRLRVRAHQGHCAMCHHQGTFDSAAEHRVEPNWTEYERGRSSGDFNFFCPGGTESASASQTAPASGASRAAPPTGASPTRSVAGPMGTPPAEGAAPATPPPAAPQGVARPPEGAGTIQPRVAEPTPPASAELTARLIALHDSIGISQPQEPAWREFIDAMAAAARRQSEAAAASGEPTTRLKARERDLSGRIAALRAVGTALSRLNATLGEAQRRALSEGVAPLLDAM